MAIKGIIRRQEIDCKMRSNLVRQTETLRMDNVIWSKAEEVGASAPCLLFRPQKDTERLPIVYLLRILFSISRVAGRAHIR
jgi:hypothetical protein